MHCQAQSIACTCFQLHSLRLPCVMCSHVKFICDLTMHHWSCLLHNCTSCNSISASCDVTLCYDALCDFTGLAHSNFKLSLPCACRFRCAACKQDFCGQCFSTPYHADLTCEEHKAPKCLYCQVPLLGEDLCIDTDRYTALTPSPAPVLAFALR